MVLSADILRFDFRWLAW